MPLGSENLRDLEFASGKRSEQKDAMDFPVIAEWPDGFIWKIPKEITGAVDDKRDSLTIAGPFTRAGDDENKYKLAFVRKKKKDKDGNVVTEEEWMVVWKMKAAGKLEQFLQMKGYANKEIAIEFMKETFCNICSGEWDKDRAEDAKKKHLELNGVARPEPKAKAKAKAKATLKRPASANED